ncbi:MAG: acyl carrier protein [Gemmatimonadales bacterium]|nr:MAG: acyl carrier protein [Gemmatimonadales bacterium]
MDQGQVTSAVSRIFNDKLNIRVDDPATDLFETGLLDSLAFVELVAALEEEFDTKIDLLEVDLEDFQTLGAIVGFIAAKRG